MKIIFACIILSLLIVQVQNTAQIAEGGTEGTFLEFPNGLKNVDQVYYNRAYANQYRDPFPGATLSVRTGNTVLAGENTKIDSSNVGIINIAAQNSANAFSPARSGVRSVLSGVKDSNLTLLQISNANNAVSRFAGSSENSVAGIETQVESLKDGTVFAGLNTASNNDARVYPGSDGFVTGGIVNTIGKSKNSQTVLENSASGNSAETFGSGASIAGIQNNLQLSVNRENKPNNNETANQWTNQAIDNLAFGVNGPAIAGIQNNIGTIKSSKNSSFTGLGLKLDDTAKYNRASSVEGDAIAGVQTNINKLKNTRATIVIYSQENLAYITVSPTTSYKYDSVAGADLNVNKIIGSEVDVTVNSFGNRATNDQGYGGDAIAGSDIDIGVLKNSNITFDVTTLNNTAISNTGNAIAGSLIKIGRSRNSNIEYDSQVTFGNNSATAPNGIAIDGAYYDLP